MKRINILYTLLFLAAVGVITTDAQAQNVRTVTVTKDYVPEVSATTKIVAPTTFNDTYVYEPEISNESVLPDTWRTTLSAHDFRPPQFSYWDFLTPKQFYIQADAGYPLSSDLIFRYTMQSKRDGYFNVGLIHNGDFAARQNTDGDKLPITNSFSMRNGIDVSGGVILGQRMLEAYAMYDNNLYNRYAEVNDPARINFHDANISVRFGDNFSNLKRLNFSVEAHGGYWAHRLPLAINGDDNYGEANVGVSATLARIFTKKNRVQIAANYDMWMGGNVYRDIRFGLDVCYARKFNMFNVEAGVGYMFDKVKGRSRASHFIMPHAKVLLDLKLDAFIPYVEFDTRVGQNSVASIYKRNPYIDFEKMTSAFAEMANDRSYDLSIGFSGSVNTRFAYRAYFGVSFVRDNLFFYINHDANFGATTANNTRLIYGAEIEYMPIGGLRLGGSIHGVVDTPKSLYYINDPAYEATVFAEYTLRRWQFGISSDFVGKRYWTHLNELGDMISPIITKGYIDLGAKVSFKATEMVDVYAQGVNLLNAKIFDYANYYRAGIGFKVGVKIDF